MLVHEEDYEKSKYICEICSRKFEAPGLLARHMMVHKGQMPFICTTCGKGYKTKHSLRCHILSLHKNIRAYNCNYCEKSFVAKRN